MKRILFLLCAFVMCAEAFAAKEYTLLSPNGKLEVAIVAEPALSYSVKCEGNEVLAPSKIGLKFYNGLVSEKIAVKRVKKSTVNSTIATKFYFRDEIKDHYNALRIDFAARYAVEFRAYDEGVAYRFITNFKQDFILENEIAEFAFAKDYKGYFPYTNFTGEKNDKYFSSFESWYRNIEISKFESDKVAFFVFFRKYSYKAGNDDKQRPKAVEKQIDFRYLQRVQRYDNAYDYQHYSPYRVFDLFHNSSVLS